MRSRQAQSVSPRLLSHWRDREKEWSRAKISNRAKSEVDEDKRVVECIYGSPFTYERLLMERPTSCISIAMGCDVALDILSANLHFSMLQRCSPQ